VKEQWGAVVATIMETDDSMVDVQECNDGVYGLIISHRRSDSDTWDDLTAYLKPEHFDLLGSVAKRMRGAESPDPSLAVLAHYAEHYCEGWCKENGGYFDDCGGCPARRAIARLDSKEI
jgi:hypothetical protein